MSDLHIPNLSRHRLVIGLAGFSGSGKTTLAEKLITLITQRGLHMATIKHAHHAFDADIPGKDSWRHRKAGASQVLVSSAMRRVKFTETTNTGEADLNMLLGELLPSDIVLVEGYKNEPIPKIEIRRAGMEHPPLYLTKPHIVAVASNTPLADCPLPCFDLDDPASIADFITARLPA